GELPPRRSPIPQFPRPGRGTPPPLPLPRLPRGSRTLHHTINTPAPRARLGGRLLGLGAIASRIRHAQESEAVTFAPLRASETHIYVDRTTRAAPAVYVRRPGAVDRRAGDRLGRLHADRHLPGDQHPGRQ